MEDEQKENKENEREESLDECEKIRTERDEYLAGWQRAKADFLNYKKDELRRMEEVAKYQTEDIIFDMLTVLDNFDLAISVMEKSGAVEKGIHMIRSQVEGVLKKRGLSRVVLNPGDPFDPAVAEAIGEVESEFPPGSVAEEIETGYRLHEKIVRPARVKISKNSRE